MKIQKYIFALLVLAASTIFSGCNTDKLNIVPESNTEIDGKTEYTASEKAEISALAEKYGLKIIPMKEKSQIPLKSISELEGFFKQVHKQNNTPINVDRINGCESPTKGAMSSRRIKTRSEIVTDPNPNPFEFWTNSMLVSNTTYYKLLTSMKVRRPARKSYAYISFPVDATYITDAVWEDGQNIDWDKYWHLTYPGEFGFSGGHNGRDHTIQLDYDKYKGTYSFEYVMGITGIPSNPNYPTFPSSVTTYTTISCSILDGTLVDLTVVQDHISICGM